jgi:hypothetical protein
MLLITLALQKSRMPEMQGVKGEAVVVLRQSLDNEAGAVSSVFPKGKQHDCFSWFSGYDSQWAPGYGTIEAASSGYYCF